MILISMTAVPIHSAVFVALTTTVQVFTLWLKHSLHVSSMLPAEYKLWGLLHDAAEAYLGDITRPVKRLIQNFERLENNILAIIAKHFSISPFIPQEIRHADDAILKLENARLECVNSKYFDKCVSYKHFLSGKRRNSARIDQANQKCFKALDFDRYIPFMYHTGGDIQKAPQKKTELTDRATAFS